MPQPRKYNSHAERQAAYHKRRKQALAEHLQQKGLPTLPAVATIPGCTRWNQAISGVRQLIMTVEAEMESYYDDRSERWQESERGEEFQQKLDDLRNILESVADWMV